MTEDVYAAVLAGGSGTRMGGKIPKQFLTIGGKPVLIRTIEKFTAFRKFRKILVMTPAAWTDETNRLIRLYLHCPERILVLGGGKTRNETLMRAIDYLDKCHLLREDTILVTHDGVRPFVTHRIIEDVLKAAQEHDACGTVIPATDTIIESRDGVTADRIPERSLYYQAQTPQAFRAVKLRQYYRSLTDDEKAVLTDACKIMMLCGEKVYLVPGDVSNFKITYPADIERAESLARDEDEKTGDRK